MSRVHILTFQTGGITHRLLCTFTDSTSVTPTSKLVEQGLAVLAQCSVVLEATWKTRTWFLSQFVYAGCVCAHDPGWVGKGWGDRDVGSCW